MVSETLLLVIYEHPVKDPLDHVEYDEKQRCNTIDANKIYHELEKADSNGRFALCAELANLRKSEQGLSESKVKEVAGIPPNTMMGNKDAIEKLEKNMNELRAYRELELDGREITDDMPSPKDAFDGYMIYKDFYERYKEINGDT